MIETMGKRPINNPMRCWGCEGDHMYRDFPHIGEKMRNFHNVHKFKKIEDMDINVPRIYASLYNKKDEFQFHIIEVEGKINNQPIVILIDQKSIHGYLDPKMVEIFQLPRSNLGKPWSV
jgi:hypothetical protein